MKDAVRKTVSVTSWRSGVRLLLAWLSLLATPLTVTAQPGGPALQPQPLGNGLFSIGSITLDRQRQRFSIPGGVLSVDGPLEYIAVTRNGPKAYESLLRLDSNAYEFNTASILVGLDATRARNSRYHFDPRPLSGESVSITVSWQQQGETVSRSAAELLTLDGQPVSGDPWRYTGSGFTPNNDYLAAMDGTLIGFVHDPASIIGHLAGLGLGDYGAVRRNAALLPPPGSGVTLTVTRGTGQQ